MFALCKADMVGSAPRPKKPSVKNPETGAYPGCSAFSCKSLQPQISRISAEIPPTFQRAFLNRECAGSNPPRSARQSDNWRLRSLKSEKGPPMAAFFESDAPSLGVKYRQSQSEIADSLRRILEIFRFSRDFDWTLSSIYTAWWIGQSISLCTLVVLAFRVQAHSRRLLRAVDHC
jgi:hypothetical protein